MSDGPPEDSGHIEWDYKEITVPLSHRKRPFQREAEFAETVMRAVREAVEADRSAGWEPDDPLEYTALRRAGRIEWKTAFSFNPLGDLNKAVAATVRLKRRIPE